VSRQATDRERLSSKRMSLSRARQSILIARGKLHRMASQRVCCGRGSRAGYGTV